MADKEQKVSENVEGHYYVDMQCISCAMCVSIAPDHFKMSAGYAYVYKQPTNQKEKDNAEHALEQCPVNAIGNNG